MKEKTVYRKGMKAVIIETGEILDIEETYMKSYLSATFDIMLDGMDSETLNETIDKFTNKSLGKFYKLSNGIEYPENRLVIGQDSIREWKLNNIIT